MGVKDDAASLLGQDGDALLLNNRELDRAARERCLLVEAPYPSRQWSSSPGISPGNPGSSSQRVAQQTLTDIGAVCILEPKRAVHIIQML
jgi:hypothetical protein